MSEALTLRPANIADLATLQHWDEQQHVLDSDPNDDWNWETELLRNPEWRMQLMAEWAGRPVGFMQIIDPALEETHYWGDVPPGLRAIDIWIGAPEDLGKGYGTKMMQQAVELCFLNPEVTAILVDPLASNRRAHVFYERLGFWFQEERVLGEYNDHCFVYRLERGDWSRGELLSHAVYFSQKTRFVCRRFL
ncbi:MAG TPA: GNAT family N-acetyltransferase [Saprospiraceae bacterium]|jgi:aminoglycoside 6'-N-acetyltransferase|nr:GNAT family N-acetyltransferase [Saprospiraceae bacterium]